jgi:hypothetical protein
MNDVIFETIAGLNYEKKSCVYIYDANSIEYFVYHYRGLGREK